MQNKVKKPRKHKKDISLSFATTIIVNGENKEGLTTTSIVLAQLQKLLMEASFNLGIEISALLEATLLCF